jgi:hypothetical protein
MNKEQKKVYSKINNIQYTDISIGNEFQKWLKTCEYIYTNLNYIKEVNKKDYLLASYKIILKAVKEAENIGYEIDPRIVLSEECASIIVPSFLEHICKELCRKLLEFYKFIIIRKLFSNDIFIKLVIKFYLDGTHIGGKEKRGWNPKEVDEIVKFCKNNLDIMVRYGMETIYLNTNGKIMIRDYNDLDKLGSNIHASFSMYQIQKKINEEEKKYKEKQLEQNIQKFIEETKSDDYTNLPPKSILGNQCVDFCTKKIWKNKWNNKKICACPVQKTTWFKSYHDIEKCHEKDCYK